MNDQRSTELIDRDKVQNLMILMGLGLTAWESVENEHFFLFRKLLNYTADHICSVLYHSPPTFESKRVLVDKLIDANVIPNNFKNEWSKINRRLASASEHRGNIAHFGLGFEIEYISRSHLTYRLVNPHLRPSLQNRLKSMQNKGYDNPKYRIPESTLHEYIEEFRNLADEIEEFRNKLVMGRLPRAKRPRLEIAPKPLSKVISLLLRHNKTLQKGKSSSAQ